MLALTLKSTNIFLKGYIEKSRSYKGFGIFLHFFAEGNKLYALCKIEKNAQSILNCKSTDFVGN